nr:heavy metal translocating P-type ATPase [Pelagibaculum spongiae]
MQSSAPYAEFDLSIAGLSCAGCVRKVEKTLTAIPGIDQVNVNLADKTAQISGNIELSSILDALSAAGKPAELLACANSNQASTLHLHIPKITCAGCVRNVEHALLAVDGVKSAEVNLADKTASVKGQLDLAALLNALEKINKPGTLVNPAAEARAKQQKEQQKHVNKMFRQSWLALLVGIPLMLWGVITGDMMVNSVSEQISWGTVGLITLFVMFFSGSHFYANAWQSFKHQDATMDTLVALGTGSAWLYSMLVVLFPDVLPEQSRHLYFEASAMIVGLVNLGHAMEQRARGKTGEAVERLFKLQAKTARVVESLDSNSASREMPIEQVAQGQLISVRPGESIAVDGQVIDGKTWINESMLTGEPMQIHKQAGDKVSAGTLNGQGSLIFRAEKVGNETALAQIIEMVRKAQNSKLPIARMADTIAGYFVPTVMIVAIIAALAWYNFGPQPQLSYMLTAAVTVLIIACPCALGLATPMSIIVGVGKAAELGMLVRNGEALQGASKISHVLLDKTGTITLGKPSLNQIISCNSFEQSDILQMAASLEKDSEHPLAQAILNKAKAQQLTLQKIEQFHAHSGLGVSGILLADNNPSLSLFMGSEKLLAQHDIEIPLAIIEKANQLAQAGETPVYFAINNQLAGLFGISDPVRDDSIEAIRRLHNAGLKVVMVTGDAKETANAVAKLAGVDQVYARQLPQDKADVIKSLQKKGHKVAMCGDGINDAPALAQADVSFAIGTGTDVAMEAADITLMRDSLHSLADAIELSKATINNIKQNLLGAFAYNSLGIPVAAGALYPVWGILLNPVIAGTAMAFSSFTVVSNARRLKSFKPSSSRKTNLDN